MGENPCLRCVYEEECAETDIGDGYECCASWYLYQATRHFDNFKPRPEVEPNAHDDKGNPLRLSISSHSEVEKQ